MPRRILDIGNCDPDHHALKRLIEREFDAVVVRAHGQNDSLRALREQRYDLVLVNRVMDRDGSEGLPIIQTIKQDPELDDIPVLMITNYPEHQETAVAAGAEPGFGKRDLGTEQTIALLAVYLA
ncbi:MAG: response regulator [Pirellulaceae bacterium]